MMCLWDSFRFLFALFTYLFPFAHASDPQISRLKVRFHELQRKHRCGSLLACVGFLGVLVWLFLFDTLVTFAYLNWRMGNRELNDAYNILKNSSRDQRDHFHSVMQTKDERIQSSSSILQSGVQTTTSK